MISVLCEKQGTSYEEFSKTLSLSDYSTLKRSIGDTVSRVARQGIDKKKVRLNSWYKRMGHLQLVETQMYTTVELKVCMVARRDW